MEEPFVCIAHLRYFLLVAVREGLAELNYSREINQALFLLVFDVF